MPCVVVVVLFHDGRPTWVLDPTWGAVGVPEGRR
jgi:hypothetical protein